MKKKGLVAMGLAGVMTIGVCVPVLAAEDTYEDVNQNGTINPTNVEMEVLTSYTVKIPTKLNVDSSVGEVSVNLQAENTVLNNNNVLEISVPQKSIELVLSDDSATKYTMNFSGTAGTGKWILGTFDTGITTAEPLSSVPKLKKVEGETITKAGTYSTTVQFTVTQQDKITN